MNSLHEDYKNRVDFMNDLPFTFDITKKNIEDLGFKVTPEKHVE